MTEAEEDAKALGPRNRGGILDVVKSIVSPTAMGSGMNNGACDTAHLCVSGPLALAMRRNLCGSTIFSDIRKAFASLHRRIAFMEDTDGDDIWLAHLVRCGFSTAHAESIIDMACTLLKWLDNGGDEHAFALTCEAHRDTWFTTEGFKQPSSFLKALRRALHWRMFCL